MKADPSGSRRTEVDAYWGHHTLHAKPFLTASESARYLTWRNAQYPLFAELMGLYDDHAGETILDYGCGPGDDVVGWLLHSHAAKVIGMDISGKALEQLRHRLALHHADSDRVELIQIGDADGRIPLADASVDHINCGGVIHHTSNPDTILDEFHRVLKPDGTASIMVYNRDSVMYHLWIAYQRMIAENGYPGLTVDEAFRRSTDGENCPISIAWAPDDFVGMCQKAGFTTEYLGGYISLLELDWLAKYRSAALDEPALAAEHHDFIAELATDENGYPVYRGKHAGIGAVYRLAR